MLNKHLGRKLGVQHVTDMTTNIFVEMCQLLWRTYVLRQMFTFQIQIQMYPKCTIAYYHCTSRDFLEVS